MNQQQWFKISQQVDVALKHYEKPCLGGECDGDTNCNRHSLTTDIVLRYFKAKDGR